MTHVAICLPSLGTIEAQTCLSIAAMAVENARGGINQSFFGWQQAGIAKSRNTLARAAIDADAEYVMWIDSDVVFPPDGVVKLLTAAKMHQAPIIGCSYPEKSHPYPKIGSPKDPSINSGVAEFNWLPSGFMLVEADVYRCMPRPWYFETYGYDGDGVMQIASSNMDTFGGPITDDIGALRAKDLPKEPSFGVGYTVDRSEDVNFCRKATRLGFKIMCDLDTTKQLGHIGKQTVIVGG